MGTLTFEVPDVLGGGSLSVESFYSRIQQLPPADQYVLDMAGVSFVRPYGVIALGIAARLLSQRTDRLVELQHLKADVHLYLERMNLFETGRNWLQPSNQLEAEWARNPRTRNLLELMTIAGPNDVMSIVSTAERIFSRWLTVPNLGSLLSVLSELCANVYQHSGDPYGCTLIQKYESHTRDEVLVCLAVGDLGCGIRESLTARHGQIGQEPLDYLREALEGRTARRTGRGGLGLRRVQQIAASEGGHLWLRSETAAILSHGLGQAEAHRGLILIPGTQVAVEFHAPLRA
jgi:hypothetical protein